MKNRVDEVFRRSGKIFIGYLTCGYPDDETTLEWADRVISAGFEILEIGLPFSDPVADGPVIELASQEALKRGMTPEKYLEIVSEIRKKHPDIPLITMSYYNPIARKGFKYIENLKKSGIDGIIIPDLPLIEGENFYRKINSLGIVTPMLIPPTIKGEYFKKLVKASSGFIYAVTRTGTTGARDEIPPEGIELFRRLKRETNKPVAAGFGISRPQQLTSIKNLVDGFIIGSALIKKLEEGEDIKNWLNWIKEGIKD